jgi:polyisoprenyl-teichoic acid--peptidoglycan teichoic acid transferase
LTDDRNPSTENEEVAAEESGGESPPPQPSTYAGRRAQEGADREGAPRITDELEAIKKAISERADDGLAELPTAEPPPEQSVQDPAGEHEWAEVEPEAGAPHGDSPLRGQSPSEEQPVAEPPAKRGETVETDTLVHGDQEAAQEAALEAVRARAAAHEAKQATMPPPATAAGAAAAAAPPAVATPPVAKPPPLAGGPSGQPPRPVAGGVGEAPKGRLWLRFLVGAVLIIVSMATATAVSGLVRVQDLVNGIKGIKVGNLLTATGSDDPRTILILGSDKRPGEGDKGRSDTTILLRVDDSHINLMSIPRDLKTNIPGHGIDKFNAAYTYGGPKLTTKTVEQLTGLDINTVVNINFTGFADAVDEIGCVYIDVDHHYYHSNVGLDAASQYSEIDIPSGYQRMCGFNALAYVRYRHDDNDLVRSARQQAFLREARAQVPATRFVNDYYGLTDIFKKYTTSSIQNASQLIGLLTLFLNARNAPIKEIHFPGDVGDATSTYVTASHSAIQKTVQEFLGETATPAPSSTGSSGGSKHAKKKSRQQSRPESNLTPQNTSGTLVDASSSGHDAASYALRTTPLDGSGNGKATGVPVFFPTKLPPSAEFLTPALDGDKYNTRGLTIDGGGGHAYYGYKIVAQIPYGEGGYGYTDYFGFSGTNWTDAPIFDNPSETKTINGREYRLYYDNGRLRQVAFRDGDYAYWVENDLLETLTADQMIGMAESMTKYTP